MVSGNAIQVLENFLEFATTRYLEASYKFKKKMAAKPGQHRLQWVAGCRYAVPAEFFLMDKKPRKPPNRQGVEMVVFIPPDFKEALRDHGAKNDRNLNQEVVRALRDWILQYDASLLSDKTGDSE